MTRLTTCLYLLPQMQVQQPGQQGIALQQPLLIGGPGQAMGGIQAGPRPLKRVALGQLPPQGPSVNRAGAAGTTAREVKNNYSQQFVDTGARPQNYLRDSIILDRYEEYPKLVSQLLQMKQK